jgi:hypothetical protein
MILLWEGDVVSDRCDQVYVHSLEYWTFLCSRFEASVNGIVLSCLKFVASWTGSVLSYLKFVASWTGSVLSYLKFVASWMPQFFCFQISIMPGVFSAANLKLYGMPQFSLLQIWSFMECQSLLQILNLLECLSFTVWSESWLLSVPELFCFRFVGFKLTFGMMELTGSVDSIPSVSGQEEDWEFSLTKVTKLIQLFYV